MARLQEPERWRDCRSGAMPELHEKVHKWSTALPDIWLALGLLAAALYWTLRLEYADWLFVKGDAASIRQAIALAPGNAEYASFLAQAEPARAVEILGKLPRESPKFVRASGTRIGRGSARRLSRRRGQPAGGDAPRYRFRTALGALRLLFSPPRRGKPLAGHKGCAVHVVWRRHASVSQLLDADVLPADHPGIRDSRSPGGVAALSGFSADRGADRWPDRG